MSSTETTPLLVEPNNDNNNGTTSLSSSPPMSRRQALYDFLEAKTPAGSKYELFMVILILVNVLAFILATLFVTDYNPAPWAARDGGLCGKLCDTLWFGNYSDNNYLQFLGIGSTSVLELFTIAIFTVEYALRFYTADLEKSAYQGWYGRYRWTMSFFSLVDLASTVPFYIDAFLLPNSSLVGTSFLRMFRLFRMARGLGRYDSAIGMLGDVYHNQKDIFGTALFVGFTTWMTVSSLYYIVERHNNDLIYCGAAPDYCPDDVDTSLCEIDSWGFTDCSKADCPGTEEFPEPCYNLYNSIPMASYYALLNLFGEFPLIDQHSNNGQVVGTLTAIIAVAVFALPAGIIGNGLEEEIAKRTEAEFSPITEAGGITRGHLATQFTARGKCYNFLHAMSTTAAQYFDVFINILVLATALTFMLDTLGNISASFSITLDLVELFAVVVFTFEYCFRLWCVKEDPKYAGMGGRIKYMYSFMAGVDAFSFLPYWVEIAVTGVVVTPYSDTSSWTSNLVSSLRLLRLLRFERYTHAFTSFDDVVARNFDVLAITLFSALLVWVFFGAWLYFTERDNPDEEMASFYKTVPDAMWITMLNLSGESPLSQYSAAGKVATGILGLFATAIFGIPIGLLGAGFEEVVAAENEDNVEELQRQAPTTNGTASVGTPFEKSVYDFVNGDSSKVAYYFEMSIYVFILGAVAVGCWQTVEGQEDAYSGFETLAVVVFTIEYIMRLIGVGSDPEFATGRNGLTCRLHFIISFYSVIDILAIAPFYLAVALPNSFVNQYDEYLRMLRILRLAKLDKYVPSLTLIDDVIRLKYKQLRVAFYAAITLWILFAGLMFVFEHGDEEYGLDDPVPEYNCEGDCAMADRFQNFFDSMFYTGVHLTGDYPIITYDWPARFLCFFMVISAVGVVSVPSGIVASGFLEIVQSKAKKKQGIGRAGDDWYEERLRALQGVDPPLSRFGPTIDRWQFAVDEWLNGKEDENGKTVYSTPAKVSRVFVFLVIIGNVIAVVLESIPAIDKKVGNQPGNFFDVFEAFSVFVFATEYIARLFCAPKNREALYSTFIYATTFFGIVDFMSTAPWFIEQFMFATGLLQSEDNAARIFRIFRIFRLLQLEDYITAFSKLDNVFRASMDVLKATGLLALIIWVGCGALFFIFEQDNPNWRECDASVPVHSSNPDAPGCFDFPSTAACNDFYPGLCSQKAFKDMPNSLYYTAVFLGGEWGVVDFTWPGRFVCLFLCVAGIALYSIPVGTLFDSFGAVLGMGGDDDDDEDSLRVIPVTHPLYHLSSTMADDTTNVVQIKVLFFASARQAAGGTDEIQMSLTAEQATTAALRRHLADTFPKLASMVLDEDSITLALNEEYVDAGQVLNLKTGDTVALVPPISGG